ncbi:MAG TPA: hypothetical protein ENN43_08940 [bacterium]|nr:hypothetical protein [bacterium]
MKRAFVLVLVFFVLIAAVAVSCGRKSPTEAEPTPEPTSTLAPFLVDDMEDCNNANAIPESAGGPGYWYTYDDSEDEGTSEVWPLTEAKGGAGYEFEMSALGRGGVGCAARITGVVTTDFEYGFVGMGVNLLDEVDGNKVSMDLRNFTGVSFWAKGDGKNYMVKLSSGHADFQLGDGDDHYNRQFATTADWVQQQIPFANFTQESWGSTVALNDALSEVTALQFQTRGQPHTSIDIWVDDIYFYY